MVHATKKHLVKLKPTVSQKAMQLPSELEALEEEAAKCHDIGVYICSLTLSARYDKEEMSSDNT